MFLIRIKTKNLLMFSSADPIGDFFLKFSLYAPQMLASNIIVLILNMFLFALKLLTASNFV